MLEVGDIVLCKVAGIESDNPRHTTRTALRIWTDEIARKARLAFPAFIGWHPMRKTSKPTTVRANPKEWSEKSRRSYSFHYVKEYRDTTYKCRRCKESAVFSAAEQQHTYEVRKASIDKRRVLCEKCWRELLVIDSDITSCKGQWAQKKRHLRSDADFLSRWLQLLVSRKEYVPYRIDTATRNMLRKLLRQAAVEEVQ